MQYRLLTMKTFFLKYCCILIYNNTLALGIPRTKIAMGERAFKAAAAKEWNNLPKELREVKSLHRVFNFFLYFVKNEHILDYSANSVLNLTFLPVDFFYNQLIDFIRINKVHIIIIVVIIIIIIIIIIILLFIIIVVVIRYVIW